MRIELLDIAKAITIFLVIVGHTTSNTDTIMYRRVIYAFHMPLFFFLAGMSTKPRPVHGREAWGAFLKKNTLALAVPLVVWGLIYAPFSFANLPKLFYASWESLTQMGTLTSLWYLSAFFFSRESSTRQSSRSLTSLGWRPRALPMAYARCRSSW